MAEFRNNLRKGDRVVHADTKRPGTVKLQPREKSRGAMIVWQGAASPQHCDIMKLRLVLDDKGTIDEHPPCDGEPPASDVNVDPRRVPPSSEIDPAEILRGKRERNLQELASLNKRFSALKLENDRIDIALRALHPSST
jgi:hypothetical protein